MAPKNWKLTATNRPTINDEVYNYLDSILGNLSSQNEKAKDVRLIVREIVDNIAVHGFKNGTQNISLEVKKASVSSVEVKIAHDGNPFDPFDQSSACSFIKSIKDRLNINIKTHLGDGAPRYNLNITVDIQ